MDASGPFVIFYILAAILGFFISIVWIIFPFLVMGRMTLLRKTMEQGNKIALLILQESTKQNALLEAKKSLAAAEDHEPTEALRIAKNGQEIGEMPQGVVKTMLRNGQLSTADLFFDTATDDWLTLDLLR